MTLQYLDPAKLQQYLVLAWQGSLGTTEDPANGMWYTNGANGDNIGLYGGLTDTQAGLSFITEEQSYTPTALVVDHTNVSNLDGHNPNNTVSLQANYTNSATTSHTVINTVKAGVEVGGQANFIVAGLTWKFSVNYEHSWQDTTSTTMTYGAQWTDTVTVAVPAGKIYQVRIDATEYTLAVPYLAVIEVTGTSETWFPDRVNGHYNWSDDAGTVFGWIWTYTTPPPAGKSQPPGDPQGQNYTNEGNGAGALAVPGTLTAAQTADFNSTVIDITPAAHQHIMDTQGRPLTESDVAGLPLLDGKPV